MKNYNQFIVESKSLKSLNKRFSDIMNIDEEDRDTGWNIEVIEEIKSLIKQGVDINMKNYHDETPLWNFCAEGFTDLVKLLLEQPSIKVNVFCFDMYSIHVAASTYREEILKLLLERPEIDINVKDWEGKNFMESIPSDKDKSFLIDYDMQKKILDNKREDIILFLNKYGLVHPKIKEEYPGLIKANEWGLI